MKKILLAAVFCFTALTSFSQINYDAGYIVDNNGNRTQVLIRNVDSRKTPSIIEYKNSETSAIKTASVIDLQEFGIGKSLKFTRHTVLIDQSPDNQKNLSRTRNPEFEEKTVFLKVLLEGKASLLQYSDDAKNRFLFSTEGKPVEQFVFKQYQSPTGRQRGNNNYFRQQLLNNFSCSGMGLKDVESLSYSENVLRSFFKEYHKCIGEDYVEYGMEAAAFNGTFSVSLKGGLSIHTVKLERIGTLSTIGRIIELESDPSPQIGVELEYGLPFNKNKWSVISDISYYQVKGEQDFHHVQYAPERKTTFKVDYSVLSVPLGIRHYFFLNDNSAVYANLAYEFSSYFSGGVEDSERAFVNEIELGSIAHALQLGIGYSWNKKIGAEIKYSFPKDFLAEHAGSSSANLSKWEGSSSYLSFLLSYKLF